MDSEKLREIIKARKLTVGKIAKSLGYGYSHLYYKIVGKKDWTLRDVNRVGDFLNLSKRERLDIFLN